MSLNFLSFKRIMQRLIVIIPGRVFNSLEISVTFFYTKMKIMWFSLPCSTVEPVLRGPPLLSGQFSKPGFSLIQTLYLLPVLGGQLYQATAATLWQSHVCLSSLFLPVLSGHPWTETKSYVIFCAVLLCLKCHPSSL